MASAAGAQSHKVTAGGDAEDKRIPEVTGGVNKNQSGYTRKKNS